jgi:hypothetical protein
MVWPFRDGRGGGAEIADKMSADDYAGDKNHEVTALLASLDMFTPTGLMPQDGPPTALTALSAFDPNVQRQADRPVANVHGQIGRASDGKT